MTRMQQFDMECKNITKNAVRNAGGEIKYEDASLCCDLENACFSFSWNDTKIPAGNVGLSTWIKKNGFIRCKKSEATHLLIIGEKANDLWVIGKHKNYWLTR